MGPSLLCLVVECCATAAVHDTLSHEANTGSRRERQGILGAGFARRSIHSTSGLARYSSFRKPKVRTRGNRDSLDVARERMRRHDEEVNVRLCAVMRQQAC